MSGWHPTKRPTDSSHYNGQLFTNRRDPPPTQNPPSSDEPRRPRLWGAHPQPPSHSDESPENVRPAHKPAYPLIELDDDDDVVENVPKPVESGRIAWRQEVTNALDAMEDDGGPLIVKAERLPGTGPIRRIRPPKVASGQKNAAQYQPGKPAWCQFIAGTEVKFPHKPYGSQIGLMDKVIRCLKNKENGLLESPTGSGKSLALLCSSLAYQKQFVDKDARQKALAAQPASVQSAAVSLNLKRSGNQRNPLRTPSAVEMGQGACCGSSSGCSSLQNSCAGEMTMDADSSGVQSFDFSDCDAKMQMPDAPNPAHNIIEIPQIYFCTRTHKQIAQLIRELRKTAYQFVKMTILGSREQYCIHEYVSQHGNKNENCARLLDNNKAEMITDLNAMQLDDPFDPLDGKTCGFFGRAKAANHAELANHDLQPFDIEDLVGLGKIHKFCPYYASRELRTESHLIFTPYNYLVDAKIRATMEISLDNAIVIFDEGHNMEDAAREAASYSMKLDDLKAAIQDLEMTAEALSRQAARMSERAGEEISPEEKYNVITYSILPVLRALDLWVEGAAANLNTGIGNASKVVTGREMILIATDMGVGPDKFPHFKANVDALYAEKSATSNEQQDGPDPNASFNKSAKITSGALLLLGSLSVVLDYLYRGNCQHAPDYNIVLTKERNFQPSASFFNRKKRGHGSAPALWNITLNFWSLNPAVAFGDFKVCHSVVLTSGTLSPMGSFQSELGLQFHVRFEAPHVIDDGQVWAGAIGLGPGRASLLGTYKNAQTWTYQDDVGNAILQVCQIVPKGILCFFTSYKAMETNITRWKDCEIFDSLMERKLVLQEPQRADKETFAAMMQQYYSAIKGRGLQGRQNGALMFGVFRGKISEGLDFADDNARAVITVGLPYPYFQDLQVQMKRKYNDERRSIGLLSGDDWYDIQAFRAINQALGRCLRHKNDWGALILLEQRFANISPANKFVNGLSKWLRVKLQRSAEPFAERMSNLQQFVERRLRLQPTLEPANLMDEDVTSELLTDDEDSPIKPKMKKPTATTSQPVEYATPQVPAVERAMSMMLPVFKEEMGRQHNGPTKPPLAAKKRGIY